MRSGVLALTSLVLVAGCSVPGLRVSAARSDSPSATSSSSPGADSSGTAPKDPAALTCEAPPRSLLDATAAAVASHPGPITRSASVFAATTPTGDWYVLALERAYVHDDGSPAEGASRGLALVNVKAAGDVPRIIDIGAHLKSGGVSPDWSRVTWTGATLDAGHRAAAAAIGCLDTRS